MNNITKIHQNIMEILNRKEEETKDNEEEKQKRKYRLELEKEGFIYPNLQYKGCSRTSQEDVENNPEKYVIEECLNACKILWGKNIYTFMCSEYADTQSTWIEMLLDNLSDENKEIIKNLDEEKYIKHYGYHHGSVLVGVRKIGYQAKEEITNLAGMFKLQDVPENEACISLENALISLGYFKEIPNPDYVDISEVSISSWEDLQKLYDHKCHEKTLRVYDATKITKPIPEILAESEYILDEESEKIYRSLFHLKKHQEYKRKSEIINKLQKKNKIS